MTMRSWRPHLSRALVVAACALGCSSSKSSAPIARGGDDTSDAGGTSDSSSDASSDAPTCSLQQRPAPPGPALRSRDAIGSGACAGKTLGGVLDAIHAAHPELADIATIYDPAPGAIGDGSFVYPFALPDGGFAIVFKRGGGDCPAGCTENEYWYFRTDAACVPSSVGHYHPTFGPKCITIDGSPMWATPNALDPASICAADLTPQDVSGTYALCADGKRTACTDKAGAESFVPIASALTMTIAQRAGDRSKGTVTLAGTGHPLIDGVPLDATFERRRFDAKLDFSNLPAECPRQYQIEVRYDFEGIAIPGHLHLFETMTLACPGSAYCKGLVDADFVVR